MAQPVAMAVLADETPFFNADAEGTAAEETPREEDPNFLGMTATGQAMPTNGPAASPAHARPSISRGLVVGLSAGGLLLFSSLCMGMVFVISKMSGCDEKPLKNPGSLHIIEAKFSMPSKTITPPDRKFVLVKFERIDYKGPVRLSLKDLPERVNSTPKVLPAGATQGDIAFTVSLMTEFPPPTPIKVVLEGDGGVRAETTLELIIVP
jgi:hypothetical protein